MYEWLQFIQLITCPVKSSTIIFFLLVKDRLSRTSVIFECRDQLVHKIARQLSQSVGLKNKQQFLTTKAVIKQTGFHKAADEKKASEMLFVPHRHMY